jgi:mycothiol synthase
MLIEVRPYAAADLERLRSITADPSLTLELETIQGPGGLEQSLADPFHRPEAHVIGFADGEPAGFAAAFVLPSREELWAIFRMGVVERHRRRGLASALLEASAAALDRYEPGLHEVCLSAWTPNEAAEAFAARHGFAPARTFWLMDRPRGAVMPVEWPAGIETRDFDGSDRAYQDWSDLYNISFAEHYHSVVTTPDDCRKIMARPSSDPTALILAYRDGRCVGFCRNDRFATRGEIGVLGVDPMARGIGLGRALLRWGVAWLESRDVPRVTLIVDGQNENALRLYRAEGFEIVRTREVWTRRRVQTRPAPPSTESEASVP